MVPLQVLRHFLPGLVIACGNSAGNNVALTAADSVAVRTVQNEYVRAWLADDTTAVLGTFTVDAVIIPPGTSPKVGRDAIRDYWWPRDGSRTRITSFDLEVHEMGGRAPLVYSRGASRLSWTYDRDTTHQVSTDVASFNLMLLKRQDDGSWRISHQMWGPPIKP
jgi:uncharacterized protein (TIGR02246 family)